MSKTVLILRGLPGAGKSHLAQSLVAGHSDAIIVSADYFFIDDEGHYGFDVTRLSEAHGFCRQLFRANIAGATGLIIVDNTNTQEWEFDWYEEVAKANGYQVHHVIVENRHGGTSTHDVPKDKVDKMRERFEVQL